MNKEQSSIYKKLMELKDWNQSEEDLLFDAVEELLTYLNKHTNYNWDKEEVYDNCVVTDTEDDYIEVFVNVNSNNKTITYTIDDNDELEIQSLEELVNNLPTIESDDNYIISYGRGDVEEFDSLEDAKEWQVENIFEDLQDEDDEEAPVRYDWEDISKETDGEYLYEFVMFDKDNEKIDTDTSDGSGWFIQKAD